MKNYLSILFLLFVCLTNHQTKAQQLGIFTNYLLNDYYYNPAVVGAKDVVVANLNYRNQWTGFTDAPVSYLGSIYGSIKNKRKVGLGGMVIADKSGLMQRTGGYFTYAYHFKLSETLRLSLGISAGYLQYRVRTYDARLIDKGDNVFEGNVMSANAFDANSGAYLYHKNFFIGISGNQLLNYKVSFANANSHLTSHLYAMAGYNLKFGSGKEKKNEIQPSALLRTASNNTTQADVSLKYTYNKTFWLAASYRTESAICAMLGFSYKERFNVAYSYDYALNKINRYSIGSHEFWLSYTLTKKKRQLTEEELELDNSVQQLYKQQQQK